MSDNILACPENTYGRQCKPCGHCQNPPCTSTSETGVCVGGCTAGYEGANCQTGIITSVSYSLSQMTFHIIIMIQM